MSPEARVVGYVELSFSPSVPLISVVRRFVMDFYERTLGDAELTSRIGLVTHELLENAVKYSVDGDTHIRIDVIPGSPGRVRVRTRNKADPAHVEVLRHTFAQMRAAGDATDYYQRLMRDSLLDTERSGLGLGRIWSEGEMELEYATEDDCVILTAEATVLEQAAA